MPFISAGVRLLPGSSQNDETGSNLDGRGEGQKSPVPIKHAGRVTKFLL